MSSTSSHYDFIIIGSGFGGSISAMRLTQKGYKVAVIERGKWFKKSHDFPKTNWNLRKYLWAPLAKCFGLQAISFLKGVMILHGVGVGGGSLVYANTLLIPEDNVFKDTAWPQGLNWKEELAPFYAEAKKMLGASTPPKMEAAEEALRDIARSLGKEDSFAPISAGVYFDNPGQSVTDPYFGGQGPKRTGCIQCGGCLIGCRHGSKNSLDKNYLYLAQKWGADIFAETDVEKILSSSHGYTLQTTRSTSWLKQKKTFKAERVIIAGGVMGTLKLLLKNKYHFKTLPKISDRLGEVVRTNGESLLGATTFQKNKNFSKGIAIASGFKFNEQTKIEAVKYPEGSGFMRLLSTPLVNKKTGVPRALSLFFQLIRDFPRFLRLQLTKDWAKNTIILLVMKTIENKMRLKIGRSYLNPFRIILKGDPQSKIPSYIPEAQEATQMLSENIQGYPQNNIAEVLLDIPSTAHILGGACLGENSHDGVVDTNHQVFHYPGLYICDGSSIPANLGVNPSLTISAMTERFVSQFPVKPGQQKKDLQLTRNKKDVKRS